MAIREVIPAPVPGLDVAALFGQHQSAAVRVGDLVYCSGMVAVDPATGLRDHGTVTSETRRIFGNLKLLLESAGSSLDQLVQIHAMIYDRIEYDVLNRIYRSFVPAMPPARTVWSVEIENGFKVELDVVACTAGATERKGGIMAARQLVEPKNPALNVSRNLNLPHSPGIRVGDMIFLSGMVSIDPESGERNLGTVASETRQILENMAHMLDSAGSSLDKVVKLNVLIYSMLEYDNVNSVFRKFFPKDPPARTVCGVQLSGGHKVEIECIAVA